MNPEASLSTSKPLTVRIIGVGGAGTSALEYMSRTPLGELPLTAVHTHARVLEHRRAGTRMLVGVNRTHGLGTGGDPELARIMGEAEASRFEELCAGTDLVFLLAGMGGGTGTGLTPVLAAAAKKAGALVLAIVTMPFEFEGIRRNRQAQVGIQSLRMAADAVICVPNDGITSLLNARATVVEAFNFTNELLTQGVAGIWRMLTRPGLINVDFAYLYSVLRGRQVESLLAAAEASGENRARELVAKLLENPWLNGGKALSEADEILVSLTGGADLAIAEINQVMELLTPHIGNARLTLGTALDDSQPGQISLTLIAARNTRAPVASENELAVEAPVRSSTVKPAGEFDTSFFGTNETPRPPARFVAPAPASTPQRTQELMEKQPKGRGKWKQELLALEIVSRGRFEKSEPTVHYGADLDVPTYIRRGVPMN